MEYLKTKHKQVKDEKPEEKPGEELRNRHPRPEDCQGWEEMRTQHTSAFTLQKLFAICRLSNANIE